MKRSQRFLDTVIRCLLIGGVLVSGTEAHAKWIAPVERWISHARHPELSLHQAVMTAARGSVSPQQFTLEHSRTIIGFAAYSAHTTRGKISRVLSTTNSLPHLIEAARIISGSAQVAQDPQTADRQYLVTGARIGGRLIKSKKDPRAMENALLSEIKILEDQYAPARPSTAAEAEQ